MSAIDRDEGNHAQIFYHILTGNKEEHFRLDRISGVITTTTPFDREKMDEYNLYIKATNDPDYSSFEVTMNLQENHN